ncbi:hypothetical protein IF2G_09821 [Cordyceps javanica]|nr:hypothetical protein IF2G_09821 [Cordyceps javanica]
MVISIARAWVVREEDYRMSMANEPISGSEEMSSRTSVFRLACCGACLTQSPHLYGVFALG